jgi:outer membrane immunogenic protein
MRSVGPGSVALALAAMIVVAPARAADLPAAPNYYPPTPMPPAIYNWTGFYAGGNIGAGLLDDRVSQNGVAAVGDALTGSITVAPLGIVGGAQVGVNYQFTPWVIGAEASWDATTLTSSPCVPTTSGTFERFTSAPLWYAAITGRVGYAANDLLFYAKGGGALLHVAYTQDILTLSAVTSTQSIGDNRSGFTVGIGLEYGMTENLTAKFEYDFYDFGSKTYQFPATPVAVNSNLNTLTVGLNYRFNWANAVCPTC